MNENLENEKILDEFAEKNITRNIIIPQNLRSEINKRIFITEVKKSLKGRWIIGSCAILIFAFIITIVFISPNISNHVNKEIVKLNTQSTTISKLNLANTYFPQKNNSKSSIEASWAAGYYNITDLYKGADEIIIADVVGSGESINDKSVDFTRTNVKVVKSLKNVLKEGQIVPITETGSVIGESNDLSIDGVPLLRQNMKVILFIKIRQNNTYIILNDYAGKYFISSSGAISYSGNLTAQQHIQMNDIKDGSSIDDFLALIAKIK